MKGVSSAGRLTHLEACSCARWAASTSGRPARVGGQPSHFTVSEPQDQRGERVRAAQNKAQRAFKSMDPDECGFIGGQAGGALMNVDSRSCIDPRGGGRIGSTEGLRTDGDIIIGAPSGGRVEAAGGAPWRHHIHGEHGRCGTRCCDDEEEATQTMRANYRRSSTAREHRRSGSSCGGAVAYGCGGDGRR